MRYMKHSLLSLAAILLLSIVLSACGGQNGANNSGNGGNAATSEAGQNAGNQTSNKEEAKTKVFKDLKGDIEVPTHPERIVSVTHLGDLLALGVKPVGAGSLALENSVLLEKELEGVANVGDVSVEKVLELNPDLIIVPSYLPAENVEQLKKIATTVTLATSGWEGIDPLDEVRTMGDLLGREKEAEEFITRYKQKAEEAKQKLQEVIGPDQTIGTYSIWAKNFWVWPNTRDAGYNLYEMFGLKPLPKIQSEVFPGTGADISLEVLGDYAADHMFVTVYEPDGGAERAKEIMNGAIWKNIPAVKNNHVYFLDMKEFWMVDGLNLEKQVDILTDMILSQNQK
ncbi:iron complex transport system substrate-binding protein [Fontibacillus phaseoli]|uniref:Iron complex transport system substrate-binding protein n=1 Tax=Fontibacillus phaseoli TaxID=1416533 RepID=A0A369BIT6_9BACL|nr:ABC transporter substrate-binding protein [Fontibacillus phaseoli]RCX20347.1 iron complex transport system substrate-binding protein [Fontibacillus phaseoli]